MMFENVWTPGLALGARATRLAGWVAIVIAGAVFAADRAQADMYFNSAEPGCNGSNPNYVMCDDFEDGSWYEKHCDAANISGGLAQVDGWCGTIYVPINPAGAAVCGGAGVGGTNCAATSGLRNGSAGSGTMADHNFAPDRTKHRELWVRYYIKPLAGYRYGHEKMLIFNSGYAGTGGIDIGRLASLGDQYLYCTSYDCDATNEVYWYRPNVGPAYSIGAHIGEWTFIEVHLRMNTPGVRDGILEIWMDSCGADGRSCPSVPTRRMYYNQVQHQSPTSNKLIGSIWVENWGNPGSAGTKYYDQFVVSKTGPIGFMGSVGAPPGPPPTPTAPPAPVLLPDGS